MSNVFVTSFLLCLSVSSYLILLTLHSGSMDMNEVSSVSSVSHSRGVSMENELRGSSLSSDEGIPALSTCSCSDSKTVTQQPVPTPSPRSDRWVCFWCHSSDIDMEQNIVHDGNCFTVLKDNEVSLRRAISLNCKYFDVSPWRYFYEYMSFKMKYLRVAIILRSCLLIQYFLYFLV